MLASLIATVISAIVTLHTQLYTPALPRLPIVDAAQPAPLTVVEAKSPSQQATISAQSYIVVDEKSGEILASHNADEPLFPASTTKVMTAYVVLKHLSPMQVASVSARALVDGSKMGLVPGETILVKDLLAGLLIHSANDAAIVLSEQFPGGSQAFVDEMNAQARRLGMTRTSFTNPAGFSTPGHTSTVRDLVILSREAMRYELFRKLVSSRSLVVSSTDGRFSHELRTTNDLLEGFDGLEGIKTGWTQEAGECLIAQATRGDRTILTAVLNSPDRFGETRQLLEWAFANFTLKTLTI